MRQGAGLIKMFVLMVLMAICMLIGFSIYANWDKDANGDGQADGFTLRLFDLSWYGMAGERARPLAKDLKVRMLNIKDKVLKEDGLIDQGEEWYNKLLKNNAGVGSEAATDDENNLKVRPPDKQTNKQEILQKETEPDVEQIEQKLKDAESAVEANDPEGAYKFDAQTISEKPTLHLEDDILEAGEHFKIGLTHYRSAFDAKHELKPGYDDYLYKAETELRTTQSLLKESVPEYGRRSDADPAFHKQSQRILEACNDLISLSFDNLPTE